MFAVHSFQQHVALLSCLINGEHDAFAAALRNAEGGVERFAGFVASHKLQLFLFSQLVRSPARASLPRPWLDQLKAAYFRQWVVQERLVHELDELSSTLAGRHEFILLKGPYYAIRFFGGINRREFCDLDILIRRQDLAPVEQVLRGCGYSRKSSVLLNRALTTRFTHALDFTKPNAAVDLHWLLSANAAHSLDYEAIWRQRKTFVLRDREFFVLSDEYEVVFSLISIFKDMERGAARLKAFVDLYFILLSVSRDLDWQQFLVNRKRERILRISVNVLAFFLELFDCADRFPQVAQTVANERQLLRGSSSELSDILNAPEGALRNKLWAADFYDCSRTQVFLWWAVSLPFRLAVHDSGRYARFNAWWERTRNGR